MDLLGDLVVFQELARLGSFSAVARSHGHAPSSISRRLDRLEAQLGQRLFNRLPTGLFLTQAGHQKLAEARNLTASAIAFAEDNNAPLSGHVSLSVPARFGELCVAPILATFLSENPSVSVDLHLTDAIQDLDRDQIDVAIRIGARAADHHVIRKIAANRRILVAARSYLDRVPSITTPSDLVKCDGLFLGTVSKWSLQGPLAAKVTVGPRKRLACLSGDAILCFAKAGLGVALKSEWEVVPFLQSGLLQHVLPKWSQAETTDIMLIMPSRRLTPKPVRALSSALERGLRTRLAPQHSELR